MRASSDLYRPATVAHVFEAGCLALVVTVPLVFTTVTYEGFELPKQATLHIILAATLVFAATLAVANSGLDALQPVARWGRRVRLPLLAAGAVGSAWTIATATSVAPTLSWFGSYQRWSGLYTELCLLVVFLVAASVFTDARRVRRLVTAIVVTASAVALYAIGQRVGLDPITWTNGVASGWAPLSTQDRAFSTLGNPGFLGAYLTLALPLTIGLAVQKTPFWSVRRTALWLAAAVQLLAMALSQARAAWVGTLSGGVVLVLLLLVVGDRRWRRRYLAFATAGLIVAALSIWLARDTAVLQTLNRTLVQRGGDTIAVRLALWPVVLRTIVDRPLVGFGPDTLGSVIGQHYTTDLLQAEQTPEFLIDRAHNAILDTLAAVGVLGALALAGVGLVVGRAGWLLVQAKTGPVALAAALIGHLVEQQFNLNVLSASLVAWVLAGALVGCAWSAPSRPPRSAARAGVSPIRTGIALIVSAIATGTVMAQELRPVRADTAYAAGLEATRMVELDAAAEHFAQAVGVWPYEPTYWNDLATAELALARAQDAAHYARALDAASTALQLDYAQAQLWTNWGLIAGEIAAQQPTDNQPLAQSAQQAHRRAIALAPDVWLSWRGLAATEFNLGNYAAAQSALARALQLWDRDSVTWELAGEVAAAVGDAAGARSAYGRALELNPADERARLGRR